MGLYILADAQVPRHTPHHNRDARPDRHDALANGGAAPGAGGQRQAGSWHSFRRTRLSPSAHAPLQTPTRLHRRLSIRRRHRTHPTQLPPKRRRQRLDRGYHRCGFWDWLRLPLSAHSQPPGLFSFRLQFEFVSEILIFVSVKGAPPPQGLRAPCQGSVGTGGARAPPRRATSRLAAGQLAYSKSNGSTSPSATLSGSPSKTNRTSAYNLFAICCAEFGSVSCVTTLCKAQW